jgi:hypothetical protein
MPLPLTDYHVETAEAALEKCWELVRSGQADLFRGQTRDWPQLTPSLMRRSGEERAAAVEELRYFHEWAEAIPQMGSYWVFPGTQYLIGFD